MKIKVKYFGSLSEVTGKAGEEWENIPTLDQLREAILQRYPDLKRYRSVFAVNQTLARNDVSLNEGDEIAVMPPFAGG